jgi:uncharacterized protein YbaP (TraB family)
MNRLFEHFIAAVALLTALPHAGADTGVPAFHIIAPNGEMSTVIGTMHVAYPALLQPSPDLFDGAKVFVIEHSTANDRIDWTLAPEVRSAQASKLDIRANWARTVTDAQIENVRFNLSCVAAKAVPKDFLVELLKLSSARTWASLAFFPCAPLGMRSRDSLLEHTAQERNIPIEALETTEQINARRAAIPERLHIESFEYAAGIDLHRFYEDLSGALNRGDFDHVAHLIDASYSSADDAALFRRTMIDERNAEWLPALKHAFDQGHAVIGVGAAHLPGERGILALLAKDGYNVTSIRLAAQAPAQSLNAVPATPKEK